MQRFLRKLAVCLMLGLVSAGALAVGRPSVADGNSRIDMLSLRGPHGHVAFKSGGGRFPGGAKVSFVRTHSEKARGRVADALAKSRRGRHGAKDASREPSPRVLAMYDVSINAEGRKWQPKAGEPVRVEVELDEPVSVSAASSLGVVHLADDGTVEELPPSRYGFTYNAGNTAVTAFWFSASGFSVYSIVDMSGDLVTPRRFYHFYGHPRGIDGSPAVEALPYIYHDESNDVVNVQIVKNGDQLKEPPIPEDIRDADGNLVSMFEGWYVVSTNARAANAVEGKLDPTNEYFRFVWPVGVTDHRLAFTNAVSVTEAEDVDYWVAPLYEHARFLQFNENTYEDTAQGGHRIIDRKLIAINDERGWARIKVSDVSAALVNSRQEYFCGWRYLDKNGQWADLLVYDAHGQPQDEYITIDNALFAANGGTVIPLYPIYVEAHFLNFDTNAKGSGATYVGSIFVRSTSEFGSVTPSGNRTGYDFAGWCAGTMEGGKVVLGERLSDASGNFIPNVTVTNAAGAVVVYTDASGNIKLNKDVTLYASWVANSSASYRVIVWQQRVTDAKDAADADKKYFYVTHYTSPEVSASTPISESMFTSFTGTRADGESITSKNLETLSGKADANAAKEDFTGFHYARWACEDATVASDGSTVINVYYDRDLITLRFCLYDSSQSETIYSMSTATSGTLYGTEDGESYFEVYYDNGQWYKARTSVPGYSYSTEHTGDRYVKSGNSYTKTTSNSGTQYRKVTSWLVITNYEEIFYNEADGKWYQSRTETTVYSYSNPYSGSRFTVSTSSWIVNQTMTGLYGQTLASNGYTWPSTRRWYDANNGNSTSGTQISFLDAFLPTSGGDETYYSTATTSTSSSNTKVYFYKENLDGTWLRANEFDAGSSSVNFNISDKYNGFEAYQYSTDGESTWKSVGTYNESTHYYGSQVSGSKLSIRFKRKEFELIYKDGDATVYDTGKNVPYESSLAGYNLPHTATNKLNWGSRDITVGTFEGWYEDASLTVPFDFTATMPDGKKFLYAKWAPIKYKVVIDPNGGEMQTGDSTWFYLDAGEKVVEYTLTRNYRLDMHNGTFYYHHDLWDPVKDKHTDQYDPSTAGAPRRAYYTPDIVEATTNEVSNPENRYSYEPKAYAFMGWYEVHDDGTMAIDPFNFAEPPNRPVTIRAIWRRTGIYTLKYESIDPDGQQPNEVIKDPEDGVEGGYIDDAVTTMAKDPTNYDKKAWVWEGWQVVDTYNNNNPLTDIRSPGDVYVVHEAHADRENVIHFRAVYKSIDDGSSKHIPVITDLVLDSNDNAGLAANAALPTHEGRTGVYTDGSANSVGGLNQGVWFAGQQNNFSAKLAEYSAMFAHDNGYFLLGWDPLSHVDSLIPTYSAVQTIGIDKTTDAENILYATWEPQIYIEFVNDTGDNLNNVQLYIPSWVDGELFRVNTVTGEYGREAFTAFSEGTATFDLAAGETLRLVLPDGADKDFTVNGTSGYAEGTKLVVTRTQPQIAGQTAVPDVAQSVYAGEHYMVPGTMKVCPEPVQVRFTKTTYPAATDVPVRYFLHDPNGTVTEITGDAGSWTSYNSVKKTLTDIDGDTSDIAALLQKSPTESVHEYLTPLIKEQYGYTTIGIGAATGDFDEWRSITKGEPSGGSYIKFYHEQLEWSRYSQVWSPYDDAAVYVVFYKRIPVHITVGKTVVGTEEDKDREFSFSTEFTEHLEVFEYTVTTRYTATRTATYTRNKTSSSWPTTPNSATSWDWDDGTSTPGSRTSVTPNPEEVAFDARSSEVFGLKDGGRHPETIYFSSSDEGDEASARTTNGKLSSGSTTYYTTTTGNTTTPRESSAKKKVVEETTNYTQTVTHRVVYRYETAVVRETSASDLYTLTGIGDDPHHDFDQCSGTKNIGARSYTISSKMETGTTGVYTYTPLDTAIFTNTRKTGSLTVTKTVVDGEAGDTFPFIVTLGETVVGKDSYTPPVGVHLGPYGKVFTFSLANGGSQTLTGLPAGASYVVEEVAHDDYIASVPGNNASGTITESGTTVAYVNTHKTDLDITIKDLSVIFTGENQHGYEISTVVGTGSAIDADGYTVTGLKSGHVLTVEHYVVPHGTAVGSYTGHVENVRFTVRDAEDEDVTNEYIINATPGTLTIEPTPIVVTVTGNHETRTYDGTEQELQGYTYVITHATTHEVITNENVYVAIPPDYQTAWQKDVGRRYMSLGANHVIVTVPEGMSVSQIVVAENGWLEITPAHVTVKANDKVKILNRPDPELTATVTGLFGDDSVDYALSRAAGEAPGTYAITASGAAEQGNYTVEYRPGTLAIEEIDLIQRATGSGVSVSVPVADELLGALGFDSQSELSAAIVAEAMNRIDPNGLRHWENLVTGTATNQLLLSTAVDATSTNLTFRLSQDPSSLEELGYTVLHELRKYTDGGWSRICDITEAMVPSFPLDSDDTTGYYRIVTLIVPNGNLSITNEIPTTNVVGVLRIASTAQHTMAAVPFVKLPRDPALNEPVTVEDYVGNGFVGDGDIIRVREDDVFKAWEMEKGRFEPFSAVKADGDTVEVAGAAESPLVPGRAVWVSRADHSKPFMLIGQFSSEPVTDEIAGATTDASGNAVVGCTMVANPNIEALAINDIDWGDNPEEGDSIEIPSAADGKMSTRIFWSASKKLWGTTVPKKVGKRYVQTFESDFEVPAGMGFWYYRASGSAFSVTVRAAEELD